MRRVTAAVMGVVIGACVGAPAPGADVQPEKPAAASASCTFQPKFKNGRRLIYTFKTTTIVSATLVDRNPDDPPQAPPGGTIFESEFTIRLTSLGVDEHGAASMAMFFDKVKITHGIAKDVQTTGEYTREEAEKAEELPEDAPIEKRLALAVAKSIGRIDVGADGVVTLVEGLEEAHTLAKTLGTRGGHMLGPIAANADRRTLSMLFRIDAASDNGSFPERKAGDAWEIIDRVPLGAVAQLVMTTALKLEACAGEEARMTGGVKTSVEPARDEEGKPLPPEAGRPALQLGEQTDKLSITWSPAHGALKKRERDSDISFETSLGERKSRQNMRTRSAIDLVEVTDP